VILIEQGGVSTETVARNNLLAAVPLSCSSFVILWSLDHPLNVCEKFAFYA